MDSLDMQLIGLLRSDARTNIAALAHRLKVSRGTVNNRIARLERDGVIVGYTVQLRPDVVSEKIFAWISIAVEGNRTKTVVTSLLGVPSVGALYDTNGRWDLLAELRAENLTALSEALERIRLIPGIQTTETSIHLATYRSGVRIRESL